MYVAMHKIEVHINTCDGVTRQNIVLITADFTLAVNVSTRWQRGEWPAVTSSDNATDIVPWRHLVGSLVSYCSRCLSRPRHYRKDWSKVA